MLQKFYDDPEYFILPVNAVSQMGHIVSDHCDLSEHFAGY